MTAIITVVMTLLVGLLAYQIAFHIIDPAFSVNVQRLSDGDYRFEIKPNFVVNSVYRVTITGPTEQLAQRDKPQAGIQYLTIPGNLPSGTMVTVDCDLQYDMIASLHALPTPKKQSFSRDMDTT